MKNFFKNMKSYKFWVNLSAALIIFLNALSKPLGIQIENQIVEDVILGFAGVLVVLGLVSKNEKTQSEIEVKPDEDVAKTEDETEENINKPTE